MKEIPNIVKKAAKELISMYGDKVQYLGEYQGKAVYYYAFPEDIDAGFPVVWLLSEGKVEEISELAASKLIGLFIED